VADIDSVKRTGGMVALLPTDPDLLVVDAEGADLADDLHLTVAYLGSDLTGWAPETAAAVTGALRSILAGTSGIDAGGGRARDLQSVGVGRFCGCVIAGGPS
jgi:hypothetical protein